MRRKGKTVYTGCAHDPVRSSHASLVSANKKRIGVGRGGEKKCFRRCETVVRSDARSFSANRHREEGTCRNFLSFPYTPSSFISLRRDFSRRPRGGKRERVVRIRNARRRDIAVRRECGRRNGRRRSRVSVALRELPRTPIALVTVRPEENRCTRSRSTADLARVPSSWLSLSPSAFLSLLFPLG